MAYLLFTKESTDGGMWLSLTDENNNTTSVKVGKNHSLLLTSWKDGKRRIERCRTIIRLLEKKHRQHFSTKLS